MGPAPVDPGETSPYQPPVDAAVRPPPLPPWPPPLHTGPGARSAARGVAVVERTGPGLTSQTNTLRQSRLRAAALFLAALAGVALVWSLLARDGLWPLHTTVGICLGAASALLSRRQRIAPLPLKALEFAIFGLMEA